MSQNDPVCVVTGVGPGTGTALAERFARGGPRARKIGIVALARKLLVALWRYLETGVIPEGAEMRS